jgi:hypothetical protein
MSESWVCKECDPQKCFTCKNWICPNCWPDHACEHKVNPALVKVVEEIRGDEWTSGEEEDDEEKDPSWY